jgi:hypothetical protein
MQERLAAIFKMKTRAEWTQIMEQTDICFAPVLRMSEAFEHPHNVHRQSFVEVDGIKQPGPAPRFLGTPTRVQRPPARVGEHTDAVLRDWGFSADEVARLHGSGAVVSAKWMRAMGAISSPCWRRGARLAIRRASGIHATIHNRGAGGLLPGLVAPANAADPLVLQLKWLADAQFAGYFVAAARAITATPGSTSRSGRAGRTSTRRRCSRLAVRMSR